MKEQEEKNAKLKAGKSRANNVMNGRALFTYNPDLFQDDDNAADSKAYEETKADAPVDGSLFNAEGADDDVDFD